MRGFKTISLLQGAYYFITGIWPIIDIRSFMAVTGPKTDLWLVQTVGILLLPIGCALLMQALSKQHSIAAISLGMGCSIALAAVDFYFTERGDIRPIYRLDGVLQVILLIGWVVILSFIIARKQLQ